MTSGTSQPQYGPHRGIIANNEKSLLSSELNDKYQESTEVLPILGCLDGVSPSVLVNFAKIYALNADF